MFPHFCNSPFPSLNFFFTFFKFNDGLVSKAYLCCTAAEKLRFHVIDPKGDLVWVLHGFFSQYINCLADARTVNCIVLGASEHDLLKTVEMLDAHVVVLTCCACV